MLNSKAALIPWHLMEELMQALGVTILALSRNTPDLLLVMLIILFGTLEGSRDPLGKRSS